MFLCNNFKQYSYLFSQRIFNVSLQESKNLLIFLVNCRFYTTNHTTFLFFTILILHNNKVFQNIEIVLVFLVLLPKNIFLQFFTMNLIFSTTTFFIHLLFPCCSQKLFFSSDKKNPHFPFFNPLTTTIILFLYLSFLVHTFQNYQRNTHFDTFVNKFLIFFPFYTFQKIHQQNLQ